MAYRNISKTYVQEASVLELSTPFNSSSNALLRCHNAYPSFKPKLKPNPESRIQAQSQTKSKFKSETKSLVQTISSKRRLLPFHSHQSLHIGVFLTNNVSVYALIQPKNHPSNHQTTTLA
ncbi:hypothetical protein VTL71DRAFT_3216 [Oculimacula yallundae]|uniref:Uncharacterized protein n=1 Tax=Oculimacula yallundae TaxID=86028 RepID=A0ABR4C6I6_9HELO